MGVSSDEQSDCGQSSDVRHGPGPGGRPNEEIVGGEFCVVDGGAGSPVDAA